MKQILRFLEHLNVINFPIIVKLAGSRVTRLQFDDIYGKSRVFRTALVHYYSPRFDTAVKVGPFGNTRRPWILDLYSALHEEAAARCQAR